MGKSRASRIALNSLSTRNRPLIRSRPNYLNTVNIRYMDDFDCQMINFSLNWNLIHIWTPFANWTSLLKPDRLVRPFRKFSLCIKLETICPVFKCFWYYDIRYLDSTLFSQQLNFIERCFLNLNS